MLGFTLALLPGELGVAPLRLVLDRYSSCALLKHLKTVWAGSTYYF